MSGCRVIALLVVGPNAGAALTEGALCAFVAVVGTGSAAFVMVEGSTGTGSTAAGLQSSTSCRRIIAAEASVFVSVDAFVRRGGSTYDVILARDSKSKETAFPTPPTPTLLPLPLGRRDGGEDDLVRVR